MRLRKAGSLLLVVTLSACGGGGSSGAAPSSGSSGPSAVYPEDNGPPLINVHAGVSATLADDSFDYVAGSSYWVHPKVALADDGRALVYWKAVEDDNQPGSLRQSRSFLRYRDAAGVWSAPESVPQFDAMFSHPDGGVGFVVKTESATSNPTYSPYSADIRAGLADIFLQPSPTAYSSSDGKFYDDGYVMHDGSLLFLKSRISAYRNAGLRITLSRYVDGMALLGPKVIQETASGEPGPVKLAGDGSSHSIVAWCNQDPVSREFVIRAAFLQPLANLDIEAPFDIARMPASEAECPKVRVSNGGDNAAIVWTSSSGLYLRAAVVSYMDGTRRIKTSYLSDMLSTGQNQIGDFAVSSNAQGDATVVWREKHINWENGKQEWRLTWSKWLAPESSLDPIADWSGQSGVPQAGMGQIAFGQNTYVFAGENGHLLALWLGETSISNGPMLYPIMGAKYHPDSGWTTVKLADYVGALTRELDYTNEIYDVSAIVRGNGKNIVTFVTDTWCNYDATVSCEFVPRLVVASF